VFTYRGKATKVNKETKKLLKRYAKSAVSYYNKLLNVALKHFDSTNELLTDKELKKICPKEKSMSTYHSEPIVERVVTIMKRYAKGEFGRPRFKNLNRFRFSLNVTIYTQISHNILIACGIAMQSIKISVPGTDVILNLRTDKRIIEGEIKRLSVVSDGCGDVWVNITTDATKAFHVPQATVNEIGIDLGCREYAVAVGKKSNNKILKLQHERPLPDIELESQKLSNAQKREDWRGSKRICRRIERKRKHYNHTLAAKIVRAANTIFIGDVSSKFLFSNSSSWVSRKAADACHGQLRTFIGQKAARATEPRDVFLVREAYTSKTCGFCGKQNSINKLKFWSCHRCDSFHDRDVNAALNMRFCKVKEDLTKPWKEEERRYQNMRARRSQPRKRRATTPVGNSLQNACASHQIEIISTASSASPSLLVRGR
jgi:putative transposase